MPRVVSTAFATVLAVVLGCDPQATAEPVTSAGLQESAVPAATQPEEPSPEPAPPPAPQFAGLPLEFTLKQRTTKEVPGSAGAVRVTVDDITRGQVMVSIADEGGGVLSAPASRTTGEVIEFRAGEEPYTLTVKELNNSLVGEDFVTLVLSAGTNEPSADQDSAASPDKPQELSEKEKIERLISHVASLEGAVFIRNGTEYSPADAAAHLRRKLRSAAREMTAEQFIEHIASKSSLSGKPYQIRLPDGSTVLAGDYQRKRLAEIEQGGR